MRKSSVWQRPVANTFKLMNRCLPANRKTPWLLAWKTWNAPFTAARHRLCAPFMFAVVIPIAWMQKIIRKRPWNPTFKLRCLGRLRHYGNFIGRRTPPQRFNIAGAIQNRHRYIGRCRHRAKSGGKCRRNPPTP